MSRKIYNKLVRSKTIDIIKDDGRTATYIELDARKEDQLKVIINLLKEKLIEEATEVLEAKNKGDMLEEIGDLLDVVDEILLLSVESYQGIDSIKKDLEVIREAKNIKRGEFLKKERNQGCFEYKYTKLLAVDDGQETKD